LGVERMIADVHHAIGHPGIDERYTSQGGRIRRYPSARCDR
ncbi:hypothetical protein T08_902, partial [Trichinella sp. T8]